MNELTEKCADKCIEAGNVEKALYYKWLRVDGLQRSVTIMEVARVG